MTNNESAILNSKKCLDMVIRARFLLSYDKMGTNGLGIPARAEKNTQK
jgi:hypothetical protein